MAATQIPGPQVGWGAKQLLTDDTVWRNQPNSHQPHDGVMDRLGLWCPESIPPGFYQVCDGLQEVRMRMARGTGSPSWGGGWDLQILPVSHLKPVVSSKWLKMQSQSTRLNSSLNQRVYLLGRAASSSSSRGKSCQMGREPWSSSAWRGLTGVPPPAPRLSSRSP